MRSLKRFASTATGQLLLSERQTLIEAHKKFLFKTFFEKEKSSVIEFCRNSMRYGVPVKTAFRKVRQVAETVAWLLVVSKWVKWVTVYCSLLVTVEVYRAI